MKNKNRIKSSKTTIRCKNGKQTMKNWQKKTTEDPKKDRKIEEKRQKKKKNSRGKTINK